MGHDSQGGPLAFPSHVLRYGFRTTNGKTGGVNLEALDIAAKGSSAVFKSVQRILADEEQAV
jgi:hypothetical protein